MPLIKPTFRPGVNRENTRYMTEGGWYECDKVRFRQGSAEVIGGWNQISSYTYQGVCRSLWNWVTLNGFNLMGVGTNLKFYIENGGNYNDITPIRSTVTLPTDPFTGNGTTTVQVYSPSHGASANDFVTFSGVSGAYASLLNGQYQVASVIDTNNYTITTATSVASGTTGGSSVSAAYQVSVGPAIETPLQGWGAGTWGNGSWGNTSATNSLRLWSQMNWGENLLFAPNGGTIYYWTASSGLATRGSALNSLGGNVTITAGIPIVVTSTVLYTEGAALQFGGNLPPGMSANTTYYVYNVNGLNFNLLDSNGNLVNSTSAPNMTGVKATGSVGSMTASITAAPVLTGVGASGVAGTLPGFNLTSNTAVGSVGTMTASISPLVLPITGVLSSANVGKLTPALTYSAYVSLIVDVPVVQSFLMVSDTSRFVFAFGANDLGSSLPDPLLIRWSNQEDVYNWTPDATNSAGFIRLSHGSRIVSAIQTRQEILVLTDSSAYSVQYIGAPYIWRSQLLGDNLSIAGQNCMALASGVVYWMGFDKFYYYNGTVQTLQCDLRRYVFSNINTSQNQQFFASTNEAFNEVWWFYCSANSNTIDSYVVYNYLEKVWYYGTMARTAWIDSGLRPYPEAATYYNNLVDHEYGLNDNANGTPAPIDAYIASSEFDISDPTGDHFAFISKVLPDLTFENSSATNPVVTMTISSLNNSGGGISQTYPNSVYSVNINGNPETFTGYVYTRIRGRQFIFKMESNQLNTAWQLGAPRFDARADGRR